MSASSPQPLIDRGPQLGMLGSFSLHINQEPVILPMNAQRLVCFLAISDGLILRQYVAGSLWGTTTERHAGGSLRSALWRLGHTAHPLVEVLDSHLRLAPSVAVDVRESQKLARLVLDDSHDLRLAEFDETLLSDDLLPDWTEDWVLIAREQHSQLRLRALEELCRRLAEMKEYGRAAQAGMMAVSAEPLRESAQRALVTVHLAQGNVAAALEQYESFRELLQVSLGLEPSQQFQLLLKGLTR